MFCFLKWNSTAILYLLVFSKREVNFLQFFEISFQNLMIFEIFQNLMIFWIIPKFDFLKYSKIWWFFWNIPKFDDSFEISFQNLMIFWNIPKFDDFLKYHSKIWWVFEIFQNLMIFWKIIPKFDDFLKYSKIWWFFEILQNLMIFWNITKFHDFLIRKKVNTVKIEASNRRFLSLIIGIFPIRKNCTLEKTPATMPSSKARDVLKHSKKSTMLDGNWELGGYVHLHFSF